MTFLNRRTKSIVWAGIFAAAAWSYAQTPAPDACSPEEVWMSGNPGAQTTVTGLRIPPAARLDEGVTFCVRGVVVRANEATMIERNGERTFTLRGQVTLTIPPR